LAAATAIQEQFSVPVIAATGHLTAAEAEAAGLFGLLSKPYTSAGLRALLEGAVEWLGSGTTKRFLAR
jgi:hypothetical protein